MGAGLVDGGVGHAVIGRDDLVGQHPGFDFLATDIGEHFAIDLDAGAEHLAAFFDHFLALQGVIDDIAILEGQVILSENGADALAPATGGFQIGNNLGLAHISFYNRGFNYDKIVP